MKHLKKGIDERINETKLAYRFCEFLEGMHSIKDLTLEQVGLLFDEWISEYISLNYNFLLIEETVHKILGYNGFSNFFFAIEEGNEEIKILIRKIEIHLETTNECLENFNIDNTTKELIEQDNELFKEILEFIKIK